MNIIQQLLSLDLSLLQSARWLVWLEYAPVVQIAGELVVIYWALLLIILWIYGVYIKNNEYKKIALSIFFTIVTVFIFYTIINLGIHKWRPGAMEISGAIAPLIPHPVDNSFPSGHALFTAALLFWIFKYYHRNSLLILTAIIWSITLSARVIGGVHYPGDILGWLLFGLIGAYLLRSIVSSIVNKILPICIRIASWIRL
jgi:membrane-associated phospholipid phosphatase